MEKVLTLWNTPQKKSVGGGSSKGKGGDGLKKGDGEGDNNERGIMLTVK